MLRHKLLAAASDSCRNTHFYGHTVAAKKTSATGKSGRITDNMRNGKIVPPNYAHYQP